MSIFGKDRATISASEVLMLLNTNHSQSRNKIEREEGVKKRRELLNSLQEQLTPALGLFDSRTTALDLGYGQVLSLGSVMSVPINEQLDLRVSADAVIQTADALSAVDIKKSNWPTHVLQLMFESMAAEHTYGNEETGPVQGLLYFYGEQKNQAQTLLGGGSPFWDDGRELVRLAAEMQTSQKPVEADPRFTPGMITVADIPVFNEKERAFLLREEMNELWKTVSIGLNGMTINH